VAEGRPDLLEPAIPGLPYLGAELVYAVRAEMACGLEDVLARRTRATLQDARAAAATAPAIAHLLAPELGWSDETAAGEAARVAAGIRDDLARAGLPEPDPSPVGGGST
jgi:glycerol-3-phosphate dehydrogenase